MGRDRSRAADSCRSPLDCRRADRRMQQGSESLGILGEWTNPGILVIATTRARASTGRALARPRRRGWFSGTSWHGFSLTPGRPFGAGRCEWTRSESAGGMGRSSAALWSLGLPAVEFARDGDMTDHDDAVAPALFSPDGDIEPFARLLAMRIEHVRKDTT